MNNLDPKSDKPRIHMTWINNKPAFRWHKSVAWRYWYSFNRKSILVDNVFDLIPENYDRP